jgi:hypothetical protein
MNRNREDLRRKKISVGNHGTAVRREAAQLGEEFR